VTAELIAGARNLIDQELGYEVQRYLFGRPSESLRRLRDDRQVGRALELLRDAGSVSELLAAAAEQHSGEGTD
jgi:hypothetical protein